MKMTIGAAAVLAAFGSVASSPATAGEVDELKALVKQLQQRVEQLETKKAEKPAPAPAAVDAPAGTKYVEAGTMPGSFKVPGTETSMKIYGYAQLDVTHDMKGRGSDISNNDWASFLPVQPLDNGGVSGKSSKGQTFATARTSRIGFQTSTPIKDGALTTKVEGDFNAPNPFQGELATNSTGFRLRHAYGEFGNWLVGQTWSTYMDLNSLPDTVDFNPPGGVTMIRQPMVRYSIPMGSSKLALAVENPQSLTFSGQDFDKTPDFIANWTFASKTATVALSGVSHEYKNSLHSTRGYGLSLGTSLKFGGDTLVASVQGGDGIGRYMFNSIVQGAIDTGSRIETWKAWGWQAGFTHVWNPTLRSNILGGQTFFTKNDAANTAQRALGSPDLYPNKRIDQASVNTFYTYDKNIELGLEYAWGKRRTFNAETGTQSRINATVHYNFF